jgi:hypothetical protein
VDAVIKYFAYGFLLTTGITLFFETLISFVINVVFFIINIVSLISYLESSPISKPEDIYDLIASFAKTHQWIFILYFFANAFVVAALVEETTKYFAFWSMEHPDFSEISSPPDRRAILRRNRESYGAAITVGACVIIMKVLHFFRVFYLISLVSLFFSHGCCRNWIRLLRRLGLHL